MCTVSGKFGFDAVIAFTGVTADELSADVDQQNVLTTALAKFDDRILSVKITTIKSDVSDGHDNHRRRRLDTEETEVTFFVESALSAFGYDESKSNYNTAYDTLEHELEDFVESGQYNVEIQTEATAQGVTVTAVAENDVDVGDLVIEGDKTDDDDDDDDTEMIGGVTRAAFAGIMVAVGIAVVGGGYYVFRKRQEAPEGTHVLMKD
jgi:hypothetical protein